MRALSRTVAALLAAILLITLTPLAAFAHFGGQTTISVAANAAGQIEIVGHVPTYQWEAALVAEGRATETIDGVLADRGSLETYLFERISLTDANFAIPLTLQEVSRESSEVVIRLTGSPDGRDLTALKLTWTLVSDVVPAHYSLVSTTPWPALSDGSSSEFIATITHLKPSLEFSLGDAPVVPRTTGFVVGFEHFRSGLDHVLIMLILAIALTAAWSTPRLSASAARVSGPATAAAGTPATADTGFRRLLSRAAATSLAFALGHSVSLVLVATTNIVLPSGPIEIAIAASIAVGALHGLAADRGRVSHHLGLIPIALIGLVHGFGFAGALEEFGLSSGNLVWSVLGFNVGLEVAQLASLALFIPLFIWIANRRAFRTVMLSLVAAIAVVWIIDRAGLVALHEYIPLEGFGAFNPEIVALIIASSALTVSAGIRLFTRRARS